MLSSLFKRELGRTVNASECVARGCAMLSPVFRVRDYEIGPFQISHGEAARVKVRVQLNLHGIVSVDSASLIEGHKENMTSEEMISENNHQSSATKDDTSSSTNDPKAIKRTEIPDVKNVSGALTKDELVEAKQRAL
ncbi:BnaA08g31620D [Brassica napus]|uniref:(rape) hypothetical protein n=1 Tax=Brassica napus TaxID=3708 RepID=A0A078JB87_BRANA|nr:unnamed protein product [Brassica napus]CDY64818.1 BnaA08g31620D [Brassica napus]